MPASRCDVASISPRAEAGAEAGAVGTFVAWPARSNTEAGVLSPFPSPWPGWPGLLSEAGLLESSPRPEEESGPKKTRDVGLCCEPLDQLFLSTLLAVVGSPPSSLSLPSSPLPFVIGDLFLLLFLHNLHASRPCPLLLQLSPLAWGSRVDTRGLSQSLVWGQVSLCAPLSPLGDAPHQVVTMARKRLALVTLQRTVLRLEAQFQASGRGLYYT